VLDAGRRLPYGSRRPGLVVMLVRGGRVRFSVCARAGPGGETIACETAQSRKRAG